MKLRMEFIIASEASQAYILIGQKLIKNAKKRSILASFWKHEIEVKQFYQTDQL